jgi:hypothetical protein
VDRRNRQLTSCVSRGLLRLDCPRSSYRGHERAYLAWVFSTKSTPYAIESAALDEYVRVFSAPANKFNRRRERSDVELRLGEYLAQS